MFSYKKTPVICTNITLDCPGGRGTAYCKPSSGVWERGDVQVGDLELSYFLNRINLQVGQSCSEWIPQEVRISGSVKKRLLGELCPLSACESLLDSEMVREPSVGKEGIAHIGVK